MLSGGLDSHVLTAIFSRVDCDVLTRVPRYTGHHGFAVVFTDDRPAADR